MNEYTPEQKQALAFMDSLRARKEAIKASIAFLNNEVVNIDIQLRTIRQSLPAMQPQEEKPKRTSTKKTDQEIIAELTAMNEKLDKEIARLKGVNNND